MHIAEGQVFELGNFVCGGHADILVERQIWGSEKRPWSAICTVLLAQLGLVRGWLPHTILK